METLLFVPVEELETKFIASVLLEEDLVTSFKERIARIVDLNHHGPSR